MFRNDQKGFGAVEILLTLLVIILTVGVGFYGYNTIANKDDEADTKIATNDEVESTQTTPKPVVQQVYVELPELGIKFPKTDDMKTLTFKTDATAPKSAYIHDTAYDTISRSCGSTLSTPSEDSIGAVGVGDGTFDQNQAAGEQLIKQFDTFYVVIGYPNGGSSCEDQAKLQQLSAIKKKGLDAVNKSLKSVEKL